MPLLRVNDNMNDGTYRPGPALVVAPISIEARRIAPVDPFNMNVTLMHKTLEIERATRLDRTNWREAKRPSTSDDDRPGFWQQLVSLFRVRTLKEATVE